MPSHHSPPTTAGVSVVIPVFNSEASLPLLVERLAAVLTALQLPFEAVFVNDGSRDNSWTVIQELAARHPWMQGIDLMRNYGQHNALLCGIRAARYSITVTVDDDLQNPPEEIPRLLAEVKRGADVAYGVPERGQHDCGEISRPGRRSER